MWFETCRMNACCCLRSLAQDEPSRAPPTPRAHTWIFTFPIPHPFLFPVQPSPLPFAVPDLITHKWTKPCSVVFPTPSSWQTWDLGEPGTKESSFLANTQALVPTANPTPGPGTGPGDPSNFIENQTKRDTKENWFRGKRFSTFAACFPFIWAFPPIFTLWATVEMLAHLTLKCFPAMILKAVSTCNDFESNLKAHFKLPGSHQHRTGTERDF